MRKTIITAVLAVLVGALLGTIFGLTSLIGHRWDVSMENADYWKQEAAKIEKTQQDAAEGKIKAPKVEIPEIEYDFGVLEKNEKNIKGSHDFLVKNVGTAPLTLKWQVLLLHRIHDREKNAPSGGIDDRQRPMGRRAGGWKFQTIGLNRVERPERPRVFL